MNTKQARVEHIMDLMVAGEYRTRVTALRLSKEWGVEYSTVEDYASEASRWLRVPPEKIEERRVQLALRADAVSDHAINERNRITGERNYQGYEKLQRLYAEYMGLTVAPQAIQSGPAVQIILKGAEAPEIKETPQSSQSNSTSTKAEPSDSSDPEE